MSRELPKVRRKAGHPSERGMEGGPIGSFGKEMSPLPGIGSGGEKTKEGMGGKHAGAGIRSKKKNSSGGVTGRGGRKNKTPQSPHKANSPEMGKSTSASSGTFHVRGKR